MEIITLLFLFALSVVGAEASHEDDLSLIGEGDPREITPEPVRCGTPCFCNLILVPRIKCNG